MKLYYLHRNPTELGTIPQESSVIGHYDFNHPCSIYKVFSLKKFDQVIFPEGLNLRPKAKFTDLTSLSIISFPLVFSKAFSDVLKNFKLPQGRWSEINLKKGKTEKKYIIYSAYNQEDSYLDFEVTNFEIFNTEERKTDRIEINNYEDYLSIKNNLNSDQRILCRQPKFNPEVIKEDLFLMPTCANGFGYIVTEPLKIALGNAGLTGVAFEEVL